MQNIDLLNFYGTGVNEGNTLVLLLKHDYREVATIVAFGLIYHNIYM